MLSNERIFFGNFLAIFCNFLQFFAIFSKKSREKKFSYFFRIRNFSFEGKFEAFLNIRKFVWGKMGYSKSDSKRFFVSNPVYRKIDRSLTLTNSLLISQFIYWSIFLKFNEKWKWNLSLSKRESFLSNAFFVPLHFF